MSPSKKKSGAFLFLITLFALLNACSDVRQRGQGLSPEEEGLPLGDVSAACTYVFPHQEGWSDPSSHGICVLQTGSESCLKCHKVSSDREELPPTCNSCHPLYPHETDWAQKENHGQYVLDNGKVNCATQCHGTDLQGGLSGISCNTCHTVYPHNDWNHGETALAQISVCKSCHGAGLNEAPAGYQSCNDCHPTYLPHNSAALGGPDWGDGQVHGILGVNPTPCQLCHGADLKGGVSGISCNSCHPDYPHLGDWDQNHGIAAMDHITVCKKCHGNGLNEAPTGYQSCEDCHPTYLMHANADTGYEGWGTNGDDRHGSNYLLDTSHKITSLTQARTTECRLCHGDNDQAYKGGNSGQSCFDAGKGCHTSEKNPPGPSSNDNWSMMSFNCVVCHNPHGPIMPDNTTCLACHSNVAAPHHDWVGGSPSCRSCHYNIMP